jgi:hypothetical protein
MPGCRLAAKAQLLNEGPVAGDIATREVVQKTPTATDQPQQAKACVMVLGVLLEVLGQVPNALCHQGHLDLGRAGVGLVGPVFLDDA